MRDHVDFVLVPEHQVALHVRLENWGRWCHGSGHAQMSPMFRMYRSSETFAGLQTAGSAVDIPDAVLVAKGVIALPEDHRHAMSWYYVNQGSPARACRVIGCGMTHLARLVIDGRTMMINRRV
jgi:hypothetical protein